MDGITLSLIITGIIGLSTLIGAITNIVTTAENVKSRVQAPDKAQNERIESLEARMAAVEEHLDNDNKRLKGIEEGNRVTLQALLAIIGHNIDGNDLDKLKGAKRDLETYLISK